MSDGRFVQITTDNGVVYVRVEAVVRIDGERGGFRIVHIMGSKPIQVEDSPENMRKLGL